METLTGVAIRQAVEAAGNVPSSEQTHNLCLHVSIRSLGEGQTAVRTGYFKVEMHTEPISSEDPPERPPEDRSGRPSWHTLPDPSAPKRQSRKAPTKLPTGFPERIRMSE